MSDKAILDFRSPDGAFSFRMHVDVEGIVCGAGAGKQDVASSVRLIEGYREAHRQLGRRYLHLLDSSEMQDVEAAARKMMADFLLRPDSVVERFAVFGGSFFMRTFFNVYCRVAKIPMRNFKTEPEARAWLKEGSGA